MIIWSELATINQYAQSSCMVTKHYESVSTIIEPSSPMWTRTKHAMSHHYQARWSPREAKKVDDEELGFVGEVTGGSSRSWWLIIVVYSG